MELKLPSRLYGEGLEPHVKKINNSCRLKLLELLKKKIEPELDEVMKDLIFSHIMVIQKNDLNFSARILHSFMEFHIDGVVLLTTDFVQKDENKDERVDRILDMINRKHDWNNHVWGVKESTSSEFEEANEEKREDQSADTERGENSHVAENVDGTVDVSGRNKRKHADRGAESRKKCLVPTSCFIKREY
uniref:Uncharacterized protein n=1 Tax=Brassica campestris TaxID=3711 RepID=M4DRZ9_BRACM